MTQKLARIILIFKYNQAYFPFIAFPCKNFPCLSEKGIGIFFYTNSSHGPMGGEDHGLVWQGKDMLTDMVDLAFCIF